MKKETVSITLNNSLFREHLKQVHYWYDRFEWSRDIDHLDNAERHANVVREFLPQ